jgi:hypothetical protein
MNIRGIAVAVVLSIIASWRGRAAWRKKVSRVILAQRVLRAHRVHLAPRVLSSTPFELYASTARPQRAEGSATRTKYLSSGSAVRAELL